MIEYVSTSRGYFYKIKNGIKTRVSKEEFNKKNKKGGSVETNLNSIKSLDLKTKVKEYLKKNNLNIESILGLFKYNEFEKQLDNYIFYLKNSHGYLNIYVKDITINNKPILFETYYDR